MVTAEEETRPNARNQALGLCPPSLILPRSLPEYVVSLKDVAWRHVSLFAGTCWKNSPERYSRIWETLDLD